MHSKSITFFFEKSESIAYNITSRHIYIIYCSFQQKKSTYCPIRNVSLEEILLQLEIGDHGKPREKRKIAHRKDKGKKKKIKKKKSFVVQDTCKGVGLGGFFGFRVEDLIAFFYFLSFFLFSFFFLW